MNFSTVSHGNLAHLDHVQTNIDTYIDSHKTHNRVDPRTYSSIHSYSSQ